MFSLFHFWDWLFRKWSFYSEQHNGDLSLSLSWLSVRTIYEQPHTSLVSVKCVVKPICLCMMPNISSNHQPDIWLKKKTILKTNEFVAKGLIIQNNMECCKSTSTKMQRLNFKACILGLPNLHFTRVT